MVILSFHCHGRRYCYRHIVVISFFSLSYSLGFVVRSSSGCTITCTFPSEILGQNYFSNSRQSNLVDSLRGCIMVPDKHCTISVAYISSLSWNSNVGSDGAAAIVLVSGEKALELGLHVIAKITGYADAAQVISEFPVPADPYEAHSLPYNLCHIGSYDWAFCSFFNQSSSTLQLFNPNGAWLCRHPSCLQQPLPSQYRRPSPELGWTPPRLTTTK